MSELAVVEHHDQSFADNEKLVTMKIDNQLFGVPILQVQDIVEPRLITPVPLAPSTIAGVMNLRGRIVTVINLRQCLGLPDKPEHDRWMGITVEYKGDLYTLLVDEIGDVCDSRRKEFEAPPATLNENVRQLCTGIFRRQGDLLVVLDVDRVLDAEMLTKAPQVRLKQRIARSETRRKKKAPAPAPEVENTEESDTDAALESEKGSARKGADKQDAKKAEADVENAEADVTKDDAKVLDFNKSAKSEPAPKASEAPTTERAATDGSMSLFERLGGDDAVEAAVDIFYGKIMSDSALKPFFDGVNMDQQSFMQRIFLTGAFGGPQAYTGRSLRVAHEGLVNEKGLSEEHFTAVAGHLKATLEELGIEADMIGEVMTIVASTHDDVLNL